MLPWRGNEYLILLPTDTFLVDQLARAVKIALTGRRKLSDAWTSATVFPLKGVFVAPAIVFATAHGTVEASL